MKDKGLMEDMVYKVKADFLRALSYPIRLKIIEALKHGEKSVGILVKSLEVEQSTLSRHLLALREAGILTSHQERTTVYYAIRDHDIFKILRPIAVILRKKFKESERVLATLGKD
ncbi:MAG: winged helix-turn-helix transcriptional regulator [Candidatus Omnitrophica bacterium]|nr:winged helix-turn-helix transcriptional regulator [Candidatus Omnitrophota bacterium]MBI2173777.1 winged helix-turn-helix transcriptional regulator [Candidatus Omnitrophota bacterium]MBI3009493.1 winged helix-turn-helix transcriptional regulator [Candidatus Omnitrophota bacterium]